MVNVKNRVMILLMVFVGTIWMMDLPDKNLEIQHLQSELKLLQTKKIKISSDQKPLLIKDPRNSEEIVDAFTSHLINQGFSLKKLAQVKNNEKNGFQETSLSLQFRGDFMPLWTALFEFSLPVILHTFSVDIDEGIANIVLDMNILHVKSKKENLLSWMGTVRKNNQLFRMRIFPNGQVQWEKI